MKRIAMQAKFNGKCNHCLKTVARGTKMFYDPDHKAVFHPACKDNPWVEVVRAGAMWASADKSKKHPVERRIISTGMRN
jgi:hypothetical protein